MGATGITHDPLDKTVSDEAVAWFTRLHSGDATEEDQRQYEAWRARSPLHAREFDRVSALWNDLDGLKTWAERELARGKAVSHAPAPPPGRMRKHGVLRWGASLVAVLLVLLGGSFWLPDTWVRLASDYHTQTGEQQTLTLTDGSMVYLDAESALSVNFSPQLRRLVLHRGRALFVVTADKHRPFEVVAAGGTVRALGTAFEVYKKPDQVVVTVLESKVEVARDGLTARLMPGQRVYYDQNTGLSNIKSVDRNQIASWRRGKLVFHDWPLGEVIEEVNRYRKGAILVLDRELRTSRVSGIFDTGNPDAVLQALEDTLPIRVHRLTRYLILLDRIEPPVPIR
jgi:transmembrane sensor